MKIPYQLNQLALFAKNVLIFMTSLSYYDIEFRKTGFPILERANDLRAKSKRLRQRPASYKKNYRRKVEATRSIE